MTTSNSTKSEMGVISDDLNPSFIFQGIHTELLSKILKGEIDVMELAKKEMAGRGLDDNGVWIGFKN